MGASGSLAQRVHEATSYNERVQLIEEGFSSEGKSLMESLPNLSEQTDNSGLTLLMRVTRTFMFAHVHPNYIKIRSRLLDAIQQMDSPNTINRDGETIINVLFQTMASIHMASAEDDEEIWSFFFEVTSNLAQLHRGNSLIDRLSLALSPTIIAGSNPSTPRRAGGPDHVSPFPDTHAHVLAPQLNVNHRSRRFNNCPLHWIVHIEHEQYSFQFLLLLLEAGVDLSTLNEDGATFLHQFISDYQSSSHMFSGERIKQVMALLLKPNEGLSRGNWRQENDWWRPNAAGLSFVQHCKQIYSERLAEEKRSKKARAARERKREELALHRKHLQALMSQDPSLPELPQSTTEESGSEEMDSEQLEQSQRTLEKIEIMHQCVLDFEAEWQNEIRPTIYRDLEFQMRHPSVVLLTLSFVDGIE